MDEVKFKMKKLNLTKNLSGAEYRAWYVLKCHIIYVFPLCLILSHAQIIKLKPGPR